MTERPYYDMTVDRIDAFEHRSGAVAIYPGGWVEGKGSPTHSYPGYAAATAAREYFGDDAFSIKINDNGAHGDGIDFSISFESCGLDEHPNEVQTLFGSYLSLEGCRLLRDALNAVLLLRGDNQRQEA